jgi:hypothetical protein
MIQQGYTTINKTKIFTFYFEINKKQNNIYTQKRVTQHINYYNNVYRITK